MGRPNILALAVSLGWCSLLPGCETTDIGAPCNHGPAEPSEALTVTFPALSCNELVCVYSDKQEPPEGSCEAHADCNEPGTTEAPFRCEEGRCRLSPEHILQKSMCSEFCTEDADCADADPTTKCATGFACLPPQDLGPYCCQPMCLCRDDLDLATALDRKAECDAGTHAGCCQGDDKPATCGP
ncbi:MAG: hypothetical protein AAF721_40590 [Myxococcota bacterium]